MSARQVGSFHLRVLGLTCAGCVSRVERAVRGVTDVQTVTVDLATGRTHIRGGELAMVMAAIRSAGYRLDERTQTLKVSGMHCASCAGRVERALLNVPGVISASADLLGGRAAVKWAAGGECIPLLARAVAEAGYRAELEDDAPSPLASGDTTLPDRQEGGLRRAVTVAALLSAPLATNDLLQAITPRWQPIETLTGPAVWQWISAVLATIVVFGPGWRFFRVGVPALMRGAPEMNSLVSLGVAAAWGYSVVASVAPAILPRGADANYYASAAMVVTLLLVGRWLEARARVRTGEAVHRLAGLQPKLAHRIRDDLESDVCQWSRSRLAT